MAELSGGMQRRLSMAAALVSSPEVLLLDEPTVGLEPVATREVHTFLRKVMPGRTVLLCTHNLAEAEIATLRQRIQPVHVADAAAEAPELLRRLLSSGLDVYECRVVTPSLEELFLDVVGAPDARA